jgi:hypothetical protein
MGFHFQKRVGDSTFHPKSDLPRSAKIGPGHRYYDPDLGRWVNRHPIGEFGGKG